MVSGYYEDVLQSASSSKYFRLRKLLYERFGFAKFLGGGGLGKISCDADNYRTSNLFSLQIHLQRINQLRKTSRSKIAFPHRTAGLKAVESTEMDIGQMYNCKLPRNLSRKHQRSRRL